MTVREFIELQMQIYGLDESKYDKIKVKVSRELQKIQSWHKILETKKVGKSRAYILDEETRKILEKKMKSYFLKQSKLNEIDLEKERLFNKIEAHNLNSTVKKGNGRNQENPYLYEISQEKKLEVMIEALFYSKFTLDEQKWIDDYTTYCLFRYDEEAMASDSLAIVTLRLNNPLKYYVKKKK